MAKKNKTYLVGIDMNASTEYVIRAKNKAEAKKMAFERFKKRLPKKLFDLDVNSEWL